MLPLKRHIALADFRAARITHRCAWFDASGEKKVRVIRFDRSADCTADGKDSANEQCAGDNYKKSYKRLIASCVHETPFIRAAPALLWRRSSVSIWR